MRKIGVVNYAMPILIFAKIQNICYNIDIILLYCYGDFSTFVKIPKKKQMTMEDVDKRIDEIIKTSDKEQKK